MLSDPLSDRDSSIGSATPLAPVLLAIGILQELAEVDQTAAFQSVEERDELHQLWIWVVARIW